MGFLSDVVVKIIKWIIETGVGLAVKWVGKKKQETEEKNEVDSNVSEIEKVRAEIIAYKKRGEKVPKDLEDKLRDLMRRLNDVL